MVAQIGNKGVLQQNDCYAHPFGQHSPSAIDAQLFCSDHHTQPLPNKDPAAKMK
jgi:hypothetical protein